MKVKLFTATCGYLNSLATVGEKLEGEVNAWLAERPDVRVVFVKQSSCGGSLEPSKHVITVWYEPAEPVADEALSLVRASQSS
jgi:hypothetical protein